VKERGREERGRGKGRRREGEEKGRERKGASALHMTCLHDAPGFDEFLEGCGDQSITFRWQCG